MKVMEFKEPRGQELINRYKGNYKISDDVLVSEDMILNHWQLEKELRNRLLESTPENRWETFEKCYTILYKELEWLNKYSGSGNKISPEKLYAKWPLIIGEIPKDIFEIGSGNGLLITYLSNYGYKCKGTEITHERGEIKESLNPNLSWCVSDGIHLSQFEGVDKFDIVISTNVMEHFHPDDIVEHFKNVKLVLRNNGKYIFETPNKLFGPNDVSSVFKSITSKGMHLKEYTFKEIKDILINSGFNHIQAVWILPESVTNHLGIYISPKTSSLYFNYLCLVEKMLFLVPGRIRRKIAFLSKMIFFRSALIIAHKN